MQINEFIPELEKRGWVLQFKVIEQGNDGIMVDTEYLDKEYCYAVTIHNYTIGFSFITDGCRYPCNIVDAIKTSIDWGLYKHDNIVESFCNIFTLEELKIFVGRSV